MAIALTIALTRIQTFLCPMLLQPPLKGNPCQPVHWESSRFQSVLLLHLLEIVRLIRCPLNFLPSLKQWLHWLAQMVLPMLLLIFPFFLLLLLHHHCHHYPHPFHHFLEHEPTELRQVCNPPTTNVTLLVTLQLVHVAMI